MFNSRVYCAPKWALILPTFLFVIGVVAPAQTFSAVLLTKNLNLHAIFPAKIFSLKTFFLLILFNWQENHQEEIINKKYLRILQQLPHQMATYLSGK